METNGSATTSPTEVLQELVEAYGTERSARKLADDTRDRLHRLGKRLEFLVPAAGDDLVVIVEWHDCPRAVHINRSKHGYVTTRVSRAVRAGAIQWPQQTKPQG